MRIKAPRRTAVPFATPLSIILEISAKPMPIGFCRKTLALLDGGDKFVF